MDKIEEVKEILLNIRQYLCNTEFAPPPFTRPVDAKVFPSGFAKDICSLFEPKPDEGRLLIQTLDPKAFTDKVLTEWEAEIRADERTKVLKEVGEWLNKSYRSPSELDELVVALFEGEMP